MMLRNRNKNNENAAPALRARNMNTEQAPVKGEKRVLDAMKPGVDATEPQAKRAAMNDISKVLSNVLIDSTKKPTDQKARIAPKEKENVENEVSVSSPDRVDPCPEYDYDAECGKDALQVAEYAQEIFTYYRHRQPMFKIGNYMDRQTNLNHDMRASLINWLIVVQEQFELNHETLYLAVKIVDMYLDRTNQKIVKSDMQLIGGTAIFLAAKYDERMAPLIDDIIYLCEDVYTKQQVIRMELILFKSVGFDLGIPLSYRFLRRFSRVIKADMTILTLARYILETSLMFTEFVQAKDDIMAAGALLLALRMKRRDWDDRLTKYTTYTLAEVEPVCWMLNHAMHRRKIVYPNYTTIHQKYIHEIFFLVASIPALPNKYHARAPITLPVHALNL